MTTTNKTLQVERRTLRTHEVRVAQTGDGNTLTGYIAVFNSPSQPMYGYTEIIAPGAFTITLDPANDIVALVNHDDSAPVGRRSAGTLRLEQDDIGLRFEIDLPNTTRANDLKVSIERKDVTGCSFGFVCIDDVRVTNPDGTVTRTLRDVEVLEVSVGVTFPAYTDAEAQLRSLPESMPVEMRSRLEARRTPATKSDVWFDDYMLRLRLAEAE